jgi:hypothetical protein
VGNPRMRLQHEHSHRAHDATADAAHLGPQVPIVASEAWLRQGAWLRCQRPEPESRTSRRASRGNVRANGAGAS